MSLSFLHSICVLTKLTPSLFFSIPGLLQYQITLIWRMITSITWSWIRAMCCCLALLVQVHIVAFAVCVLTHYALESIKSLVCLLSWPLCFCLTIRTGKTLLAKTLARIVNVPFAIADATSLTQASCFTNPFKVWLITQNRCMFYICKALGPLECLTIPHLFIILKNIWIIKWPFSGLYKESFDKSCS